MSIVNTPEVKAFFNDLFRQMVEADAPEASIKIDMVSGNSIEFTIAITRIDGVLLSSGESDEEE